jgi:hypothetical protein
MSHAGVSGDGACVRDCESYTMDIEIVCVCGHGEGAVLFCCAIMEVGQDTGCGRGMTM